MPDTDSLERMLASGRDGALLRFSLASAYAGEGRHDRALEHIARAVELDPRYSAAWKLYGKVLVALGQNTRAAEVYRRGIQTAEGKGDLQAAREMRVFLRRIERTCGDT